MEGLSAQLIEGLNAKELVPGRNWTHEELKFLIENRYSMSMSDLARRLHKTKGAIAGKSFRLGMKMPKMITKRLVSKGVKRLHAAGVFANRARIVKKDADGAWSAIKTTYKRGEKAVPKHMTEPPVGILNGVGVKMWELEAIHCKWVVGEPSNLTCCGQNRHPNSPYCQEHHNISFKPVPGRQGTK